MTAIQAVTGSGVDDVHVGGNRSITEDLSVHRVGGSRFGEGIIQVGGRVAPKSSVRVYAARAPLKDVGDA